MVLADTSAWVEFFRRTGSSTDVALRRRLNADEVATTDIVIMEVLAGATDVARLNRATRMLDGCRYFPERRLSDALTASSLYRDCRRAGETPRQLTDCLVAAVAIRRRVAVLQRDRDFDVIARHTPLTIVSS